MINNRNNLFYVTLLKLLNSSKLFKYFFLFTIDFIALNLISIFIIQIFKLDIFLLIFINLIFPFLYFFDNYKLIIRSLNDKFSINLIPPFLLHFIFINIVFYIIEKVSLESFIVIISNQAFFFIYFLFSRIYISIVIELFYKIKAKKNIIIYGAGDTGLKIHKSKVYNTIAFIDDDKNKTNKLIDNITVYEFFSLSNLLKKNKIDFIILAIPSLKIFERKNIIDKISKYSIPIKISPHINDIYFNNYFQLDYDIIFSDLANRNNNIDYNKINLKIENRSILITGAGGSIGSEVSLQTLNFKVSEIIIIDNNEFNLFLINEKINKIISKQKLSLKIYSYLCDIKDNNKIKNILNFHKPNYIFHIAAYKHVPILEDNKIQAFENNIIGTKNLLDNVNINFLYKFVFISTDKAVKPSSTMGASKRICELLIISKNLKINKNLFSIVRFGNVINSRGSVLPIFAEQISKGGPLTVSHQDVQRYFMSIPESVSLIFQTLLINGENYKFILDMGKPIKILEIAKKMILLSGYKEKKSPNDSKGIEIKITGLKDGEKINEELSISNNLIKTSYDNILSEKKISNENIKYTDIINDINDLNNNFSNKALFSLFEKYIKENSLNKKKFEINE